MHDINLDFTCKNLIYLYRNPIDTVYSYIAYKKKNNGDPQVVAEFASLYAAHLGKWLLKEKASEKKTVVCYERLKSSLCDEFSKITAHFGEKTDVKRLEEASAMLDKNKVKEKAADYSKKVVVNTALMYDDGRREFASRNGGEIMKIVFDCEPELRRFFER